ncbi:MAG: hypothetical protein M3P06_17170 [Acidobacteriota bacterium]|nr:hypothetical protein [Acidobacteriota bacterium]
MRRKNLILCALVLCLAAATPSHAFLEDLCLPRPQGGSLMWCIRPCPPGNDVNTTCPAQTADFVTIQQGRSMIHMDSTFFIAQSLGFRADVAYWIAAYNEVTDYSQYVPIDQCGTQAANAVTIANGMTQQTAANTGQNYITAFFNGFQRTNPNTDGPLDHYVVSFSPNGKGTDVHGPQGVLGLYPLHYPKPGYPLHIDDTYQKTLANLRQWAMMKTAAPGLLCAAGLTDGEKCLTGPMIVGSVPLLPNIPATAFNINTPAGKKILQYTSATDIDYYEDLQAYLSDKSKTTGTLWKDPVPGPVPPQIAKIGLFLHVLQDTASHSTYCMDDGPSPPGGGDPGTYMYQAADGTIQLSFGNGCANSPHLAGHAQETGTGDNPLPLRDYTALNSTVDELINFGNDVARLHKGWIINPELLPPNVVGGKNAQGKNAADLKAELVGTIQSGTAYSQVEVYKSGVVTQPLQQPQSLQRLHAMNAALAAHSAKLRGRSVNPTAFVPLEHMPGNSANPKDTSVCWTAVP